jgi:hypothetical protein
LQAFVKNHTILSFFGPKMPRIIGYFERLANPFDLILARNFPMFYSLYTLSSVSDIVSEFTAKKIPTSKLGPFCETPFMLKSTVSNYTCKK